MNIARVMVLIAFFGAMQAPVNAQLPEPRPEIFASGGLGPEDSEWIISPQIILSVRFGSQITGQKQTTLIQEAGYPEGNLSGGTGRVALFVRNASGDWVRSGSIDPPSGQTGFGARMALFNEFSLFQASQGQTALLYRRSLGKWKLVQRLAPPSGYRFTDVRLSSGWAFIGAVSANAGAVFVYQITSAGTLKGVQTLRSFSGDPADEFGDHVAVFGERVVVSAAGDSNNRGAAYVFERSGALFVKRQKLIAMNGAANQGFAHSIGISEDWIAIGAPDVQGTTVGCPTPLITGAIYTFRRTGGVWLQQEELLARGAQDQARTCITELGADLVINGKWLVGTLGLSDDPTSSVETLVYVRDAAGHYAPAAWPTGLLSGGLALHLVGDTLFIGTAIERGCISNACPGSATLFDLNDALP